MYPKQLRKCEETIELCGKILKEEGANTRCMAKFYITIVQAVLLYGADSWVINRRDMNRLQSFHNRAARYLTNEHIRKGEGDTWKYPDHKKLLKKCRLLPIEKYIERRRGTLRTYLEENRKELMDETKDVRKHCKDVHKILWWEQEWTTKKGLGEYTKEWWKGES